MTDGGPWVLHVHNVVPGRHTYPKSLVWVFWYLPLQNATHQLPQNSVSQK